MSNLLQAIKKFFQSHWPLLLAFFGPFIIMATIYGFQGVYPFGNSTLLTVDLGQQYVDFYAYYRETLLHNPLSFFYSFSKAIGGDMIGLWAYYLTSPFNLILILFPPKLITLAVTTLTLIKISTAGLTFGILLKKAFDGKGFILAAFSISYALMGYTIVNQLNIMWLDGLVFLPMVILGIEKLLITKKGSFYTLFLAIMLVANYYIAYMICIFTVVYFFFRLTGIHFPNKIALKKKIIYFFTTFLRFAWYSLLAGGLSAFLLIPTFNALLASKASYTNFKLDWNFNYPIQEIIAKFYLGAFNFDQMPDGTPNVFIGSLALISFGCFFFNRAFPIRERFGALLVSIFLILSMNIKALNLMWHGMQYPIWYPYRFSFVFCFFMILLGFRSFMQLKKIPIWGIILTLSLTALASVYLLKAQFDFIYEAQIILTSLFVVLIVLLLILKAQNYFWLPLAFFLVSVAEMTINATVDLSRLSYVTNSSFLDYKKEVGSAINQIQENDSDFYRIEKTFLRSKNDSFQFGYPSVTHFSSTFEKEIPTLFGNLGFPVGNGFVTYSNGTLFTDAFFGIKYFASENNTLYQLPGNYLDSSSELATDSLPDNPLNENVLENFTKSESNLTKQDLTLNVMSNKPDLRYYLKQNSHEFISIFKNPNALPIAFGADEQLLQEKLLIGQPIQLQENLLQSMDQKDERIRYFTPLAFNSTVFQNVTSNGNMQNITYKKQVANKKATVDFQFTPQTDDPYYITLGPSIKEKNATIYLNGKVLNQYKTYRDSIVINVASRQKGETITISFELLEDTLWLDNFHLYRFNEAAFQSVITNLKANQLTIDSYGETYFKGHVTIQNDNQILMTTIPDSPGWTVKIDGKPVKSKKVLDTLMAVPISKGKHQVEMRYRTPYFKEAVIISLLSGGLLIASHLFFTKGKHSHNQVQLKETKPK
ncbi:MAG: YfhO family protein [Carnobacterium sp.]|uniref:YfhO family protein n=1 Tax=unclassified Carnobacterium TaxID=257487 RepID=UPI002FC5B9CD